MIPLTILLRPGSAIASVFPLDNGNWQSGQSGIPASAPLARRPVGAIMSLTALIPARRAALAQGRLRFRNKIMLGLTRRCAMSSMSEETDPSEVRAAARNALRVPCQAG